MYGSYYKLSGRANAEKLEYFIDERVSDMCTSYQMKLFNSRRQKGFTYMMITFYTNVYSVSFSPCFYWMAPVLLTRWWFLIHLYSLGYIHQGNAWEASVWKRQFLKGSRTFPSRHSSNCLGELPLSPLQAHEPPLDTPYRLSYHRAWGDGWYSCLHLLPPAHLARKCSLN